jgi:hypothetical protein
LSLSVGGQPVYHVAFPFPVSDSGHSTLPGEEPADDLMNRSEFPELETDAADAIQVLESVVVEAEEKSKETDEKFRDLTEVRGEAKRNGAFALSRNREPVVKIQKVKKKEF